MMYQVSHIMLFNIIVLTSFLQTWLRILMRLLNPRCDDGGQHLEQYNVLFFEHFIDRTYHKSGYYGYGACTRYTPG